MPLGAPLRVYADAGHFLPAERPGDVAADIASLVRRTHSSAATKLRLQLKNTASG